MKSKALIASAVLGVLYSIYLIAYFFGVSTGDVSDAEAIGGAIATVLVMPHMILVALAAIFNVLGVSLEKTGFALTAGILYSVGGVLFLIYLPLVIPMIVLSFVGYSRMKKFKLEDKSVLN